MNTMELSGSVAAPDVCAPVAPLSGADFRLGDVTYLNAAARHPMTIHAANAARMYLHSRLSPGPPDERAVDPRALFARLINATPAEIAVVPSTMFAENLVIDGLELRGSQLRIITDSLHFSGSLYMYEQLQRSGVDVQTVQPRGQSIDLNDVADVISDRTRLIAVSLVSMSTGFKHDLKALCELAHSRGVLVYADIMQAVGNIPVDVRDSGVDLAACSSYKWLMGDLGVGFLYVREEHLARLPRPVFGYRQIDFDMDQLPYDPTSPGMKHWKQRQDARGHFEPALGSAMVLATVGDSLGRILATGVDEIARQRQPLVDFLRKELPPLGFEPLAPPTDAALACFGFSSASTRLSQKLRDAKIAISLYENRIRVSPSIYNTRSDIERLVEVLREVSRSR